jgi:hypothetical protein
MDMDIDARTEKWLGGIGAVGAGFLSWEYEATKKWSQGNPVPGYSLFSKHRFADALAGIIGKGPKNMIFPSEAGAAADFHPNPMGWVNGTVGIGVAIKIADEILKRIWPVYEKDLDAVPEVVRGISTGLIAGGALGGIFDPNPSGFSVLGGSESGGVASGNVPFGRGEGRNGHVSVVG